MNVENANTIPVPEILSKVGIEPVYKSDDTYQYISPFYKATEAQFIVCTKTNTWCDHKLKAGGDAVTFVCQYLETQCVYHGVSEALRWLGNMFGKDVLIEPVMVQNYHCENEKFSVEGIWPLIYPALIRYIENRGIPLNIADEYLKQVEVYDSSSDKHFTAIGFKNEDTGYVLRSPFFKGATDPQAISFVRGTIPKNGGFHVFQSVFDYLSIIAKRRGLKFKDDVIILNSLVNLRDAAGYIANYGYQRAYLWLDNDKLGKQAANAFAKFFANEPGLKHYLMNYSYAGSKDVNASHRYKLGLQEKFHDGN